MKKLLFTCLLMATSVLFSNATNLFVETHEKSSEDELSVSFILIKHVSCYGGSDASLTAWVTGGSGNYTYLWDDGQDEAEVFNLSVGLSSVTVTDTNDGTTRQASIIITQPNLLLVTAILNQPINCINTTASATAIVSGGIPSYTYFWDNGETGQTATNLTVGEHLVSITDANFCTVTDIIVIYENIEYPIADAGENITIDCENPNPMVTLDGTGSSVDFGITYLWFSSDGDIIADPTSLSPLVNSTGTYTLLVTNNANGCSSTDDVVVGSSFEEPMAGAGADVSICAGDCIEIMANAALGTPPYTFGWNQGLGLGQTHTVCPSETTTYTVSVTGANGCQSTDEMTITVATLPFLDIQSDTICQGECVTLIPVTSSIVSYQWDNDIFGQFPSVCPSETTTYALTITDENGCQNTAEVEVYVYEIPYVEVNDKFICFEECVELNSIIEGDGVFTTLWSTGDTSQSIFVCPDSTSIYTITITAENGCQATDEAIVEVGEEVVATVASGYFVCDGGEVTVCVEVEGGVAPYLYNWDDVTGTTANPCVVFDTPGTYTTTVTDSNSCVDVVSVTVAFSPAPVVTFPDTSICQGECAILSPVVSGGTPPYTYLWDVSAIDASIMACPSVTTTHTVEITDAVGCVITASTTVFVLSIAANAGEDFTFPCTGTPFLSGEGSSIGSAVNFSWVATEGGIIDEGEDTVSPQVSAPGTYIFTVVNEVGCVATDTVLLYPAEMPIVEAGIGLISCHNAADGFINVTVSGATPPYTYNWSNGASTEDLSNLSAGIYDLTVTDVGSCFSVLTVEFINPAPLNVTLSLVHESAPNANDGVISANVIGGVPPYEYLWNTGEVTSILTELIPGIYNLTLTDAHGCQAFEIAQILADGCETLEVISSNNSPICINSNSGFVEINQVLGGQAPYSYDWSTGDSLSIAQNLSAGIITCTVSDDNSCAGVFVFEITSTDTIAPELITQDITLFVNEIGTTSFTFEMIDNGSNDNCQIDSIFIENTIFDCSQIGENIVEVIIFDAAMLSDTALVLIAVQDTLTPVFDFCEDVVSNNCSEVFYQVPSASDNCNEIALEMIEGLASGSNFPEGVTLINYAATDASGNTTSCLFNVTVNNDLSLLLDSFEETDFDIDGIVVPTISGGTAPYSYEWTDVDGNIISTEDTLVNVSQGTYCLLLTDVTGCVATACAEVDRVVIIVEGIPSFSIVLSPNPATDVININFSRLIDQSAMVYVMNAARQEVLKEKVEIPGSNIELNTSGLSAGLYFVEIILGNYVFTEKIIINR